MYLPFERDHSQHVLAVIMTCELAGGAGIDPLDPPLAWEVWQGESTGWVACEVEYDGTGGFNTPGEVILHTPAMQEAEFAGHARTLAALPSDRSSTRASARTTRRRWSTGCASRRAAERSAHATPRRVRDEILGQSDGTPGQTFALQNAPLLARDKRQEYLVVESPGSEPEQWEEVEDFADSGPEDRHFTLDSTDGTLTLGPTLLQPDGTVYRFGATPLKRSWLRFSRYQHGGGVIGNVPRGTLNVMKTSIPYVSQVTNRQPAMGGRDAQTLDDAKLRAPQMLRTRTRAVTAEDYEYLALQVPGVARAHCLTPGALPAAPGDLEPGQVVVLVLPQLPESDARNGTLPDPRAAGPVARSARPPRRAPRGGRAPGGPRAACDRCVGGSDAARFGSRGAVRARQRAARRRARAVHVLESVHGWSGWRRLADGSRPARLGDLCTSAARRGRRVRRRSARHHSGSEHARRSADGFAASGG